jgi:hypothetical protein
MHDVTLTVTLGTLEQVYIDGFGPIKEDSTPNRTYMFP